MMPTKKNHLIDDFDLLTGYVRAIVQTADDRESEPLLVLMADVLEKLEAFKAVHIEPFEKSQFPIHPD